MMTKQKMYDTGVLDDAAGVRVTQDGYLVAQPRIARTGIQLYRGRECGKPDVDTVRLSPGRFGVRQGHDAKLHASADHLGSSIRERHRRQLDCWP
jgi:predicted metalloprotease